MMTKKAQVVPLPTTHEAHAFKVGQDGRLRINTDVVEWHGQSYHLYLATEDSIKQGHHVLVNNRPDKLHVPYWLIGKVVAEYETTIEIDLGWSTTQLRVKADCKKIVATTNKTLHYDPKDAPHMLEWMIPRVANDFVTAYVRAQGKITEVLLEMEDTFNDVANEGFKGIQLPEIWKLKLRSDNSVIIHQLKEKTYTRDEVLLLLERYIMDYTETRYSAVSPIMWLDRYENK